MKQILQIELLNLPEQVATPKIEEALQDALNDRYDFDCSAVVRRDKGLKALTFAAARASEEGIGQADMVRTIREVTILNG